MSYKIIDAPNKSPGIADIESDAEITDVNPTQRASAWSEEAAESRMKIAVHEAAPPPEVMCSCTSDDPYLRGMAVVVAVVVLVNVVEGVAVIVVAEFVMEVVVDSGRELVLGGVEIFRGRVDTSPLLSVTDKVREDMVEVVKVPFIEVAESTVVKAIGIVDALIIVSERVADVEVGAVALVTL